MRIMLENRDKKNLQLVINKFNGMVTGEIKGNRFIGELDFKRFYNSEIRERKNNRANIKAVEKLILTYRNDYYWTYQEIADYLNQMGYETSRGKDFKKATIKRIYDKCTS